MDDFVISNLQESKNEWCGRLVSILCPLVIEGVKSIFNEACKMCLDKDESEIGRASCRERVFKDV